MFDINEEEVDRLYGKLNTIWLCLKLRDLGYEYEKGEFITIDLRVEEDGYGSLNQEEVLTGLLGTAIGDGCVKSNDDMQEELKALGAKIPHNLYDKGSVCGFTLKLDNEDTNKYIRCNIKDEDMIRKNQINMAERCCFYEESDVKDIQIILDHENGSIFIVTPEEYVMIDEFFDSCIDFLADIQESIKKYEENLIEGDVA